MWKLTLFSLSAAAAGKYSDIHGNKSGANGRTGQDAFINKESAFPLTRLPVYSSVRPTVGQKVRQLVFQLPRITQLTNQQHTLASTKCLYFSGNGNSYGFRHFCCSSLLLQLWSLLAIANFRMLQPCQKCPANTFTATKMPACSTYLWSVVCLVSGARRTCDCYCQSRRATTALPKTRDYNPTDDLRSVTATRCQKFTHEAKVNVWDFLSIIMPWTHWKWAYQINRRYGYAVYLYVRLLYALSEWGELAVTILKTNLTFI